MAQPQRRGGAAAAPISPSASPSTSSPSEEVVVDGGGGGGGFSVFSAFLGKEREENNKNVSTLPRDVAVADEEGLECTETSR